MKLKKEGGTEMMGIWEDGGTNLRRVKPQGKEASMGVVMEGKRTVSDPSWQD